MLCNGVLLNGSPPSSSGSAGKNAALSNQKHMPFKEQKRTPLAPSLPLFRTQGNTETQAPFGDHLPPDRYCCVDFSDTRCVIDPLHLLDGFCFTCTSHTSQKNKTKLSALNTCHTLKKTSNEKSPASFSQLKFEVTYNQDPTAASSFITLLLLPCTPYNTQLLSSAPVDASGQYRQLEHKTRCFKPNLVVFLLCTTIPISSGTKLPEEQEGYSRVKWGLVCSTEKRNMKFMVTFSLNFIKSWNGLGWKGP